MSLKLANFLKAANDDERRVLAEQAGTSVEYLYHLARGYGNRKPSVQLAVGIEKGTRALQQINPQLPIVTCYDLAA